MRIQAHLEHFLDYRGEEHPVGVRADSKETDYVDSFTEAANVTSHLEE